MLFTRAVAAQQRPTIAFRGRNFQRSRSTIAQGTSRVLLTREAGKNDAVAHLLQEKGISFYELPMIQTTKGPDRDKLQEILQSGEYEWTVLTSPEAASVFAESWHAAGRPDLRIAVVGKGTAKALARYAPHVQTEFVPSVANAETLSAELPLNDARQPCTVLYPASFKAKNTLQQGLESRGCRVMRMSTYDTEEVQHVSQHELELALACDIIAIASPSALKAWINIAGEACAKEKVLACIGSTSGRAALALGHYPDRVLWSAQPGLHGSVTCIEQAVTALP